MPTPEALRVYDDPDLFPRIRVEANGLTFSVREAQPVGGGEAKLALLLHGFPESSYSWRYQMRLLAERGYRVWAPDLRGYGESDKPRRVADYRVSELVLDVAGLIDASGAKEVLLVGHDWGGVVAWHFALRRLRPLAGLVVLNIPHPRLFQRAISRPGRQLLRSWYIFAFQIPFVAERMLARDDYRAIAGAFLGMAVDRSRFPREVIDVYKRSARAPGALSGMLAYYRAAVRYRPVVKYPVLTTKTLMIWGEEDRALGKELTDGTDALVRDFTLRFVPRCSHWVQQEAPETVNAMLADWLDGAPVREADAR